MANHRECCPTVSCCPAAARPWAALLMQPQGHVVATMGGHNNRMQQVRAPSCRNRSSAAGGIVGTKAMSDPRIVHVDDCPDIRVLVQIALEMVAGLPLVQFESGDQVVRFADTIEADLFLLDVMMPGLSGPQAFRLLRAMPKFASTPAIFLTAKATERELKDLNGPGVLGTITKPFDALQLGQQVRKLWEASLLGRVA